MSSGMASNLWKGARNLRTELATILLAGIGLQGVAYNTLARSICDTTTGEERPGSDISAMVCREGGAPHLTLYLPTLFLLSVLGLEALDVFRSLKKCGSRCEQKQLTIRKSMLIH